VLVSGGDGGCGLPGDAGVRDDDGKRALGAFFEEGPVGFVVVVGAVGVEKLHVAGADDFEAVVEVCAGGEGLSSEAGAGVVDFEEFDGLAGSVADGGGDVRGLAAGCGDKAKCDDDGEKTHANLEYQAVLTKEETRGEAPNIPGCFSQGDPKWRRRHS
jgi:hypothetical protein